MVHESDLNNVVVLGVYSDIEILIREFEARGIPLTQMREGSYIYINKSYLIYILEYKLNCLDL